MLSCISVNVYADSGLDDILPSSTSDSSNADSTSDSSIEDFIESDSMEFEQEEIESTSDSNEVVTQNYEQSSVSIDEARERMGLPPLELYEDNSVSVTERTLQFLEKNEISEEETDHTDESYLFSSFNKAISTLASTRGIDWSTPARVEAGPSGNKGYINGYFKGQSVFSTAGVNAQQTALQIAWNFDMVIGQAKNSFSALEINDWKIVAEMYSITDSLSNRINTENEWRIKRDEEIKVDVKSLLDWRVNQRNANSWFEGRLDELEAFRTRQSQWNVGADERINGLSSWRTVQSLWNVSADDRINGLLGFATRQRDFNDGITERVNSAFEYITRQRELNTFLEERANSYTQFATNQRNFNDGITERVNSAFEFITRQRELNTFLEERANAFTGFATNQRNFNDGITERVNSSFEFITRQRGLNDYFNESIDDLNRADGTQLAWNAVQLTNNVTQGNRITALENEISNFNLSDLIDLTVVVTAINSFKKAYTDSIATNGDLYNLIRGAVTGQTTSLISYFNELFDDYFGDWENSIFWVQYGLFEKRHMAIFIEVFLEELDSILDKYWLEQLETWNLTNDVLLTGNNWLEMIYNRLTESYEVLVIITNWLDQIYKKPFPITPPIPFDYIRLEKMLKKLEFGEIVNEAGTNMWDFLSDTVKELGKTIRTGLTELADVLDSILDFLDSLIDKLIQLIVPEDIDFIKDGFDDINVQFDVKFGAFLGLADSVKNIFTPISGDFKEAISFDFMGASFKPDFTMFDNYIGHFRNLMSLSIWMSVAIYIYRKLTGTGDLINDN